MLSIPRMERSPLLRRLLQRNAIDPGNRSVAFAAKAALLVPRGRGIHASGCRFLSRPLPLQLRAGSVLGDQVCRVAVVMDQAPCAHPRPHDGRVQVRALAVPALPLAGLLRELPLLARQGRLLRHGAVLGRPAAPVHGAAEALPGPLHEHGVLEAVEAVRLPTPLPAQVQAPAHAVRVVRQRAVRDDVVEEERRAEGHLARHDVPLHVAAQRGLQLLRDHLGVPGAAHAAGMVGCATWQVAPVDDLHTAVRRVGVDERHPGSHLQLVPTLLVQVGRVLVPGHRGLALAQGLRRLAAQVPDGVAHDVRVCAQELLGHSDHPRVGPEVLDALGQHAVLVQQHVGVRELPLELDQPRVEARLLAGVLDLAGRLQPLRHVAHERLHRADGGLQRGPRHDVVQDDPAPLEELRVLLARQGPSGRPLVAPGGHAAPELRRRVALVCEPASDGQVGRAEEDAGAL
mmetsp:Transcript_64123/g.198728  ORF Transcript_64123/g.198728 Transcript_64123/m.198728 type:complete len:458 (-) Transcript_64123:22-1395(-)